jgi:hypothetical protein
MFKNHRTTQALLTKLIVVALLFAVLSVMATVGEEHWLIRSFIKKEKKGGELKLRASFFTRRNSSATYSRTPNHTVTDVKYFALDENSEAIADAAAYRRMYQLERTSYQNARTTYRIEEPLRSCEAAAESSSGAAAASKAALAESRASTASALEAATCGTRGKRAPLLDREANCRGYSRTDDNPTANITPSQTDLWSPIALSKIQSRNKNNIAAVIKLNKCLDITPGTNAESQQKSIVKVMSLTEGKVRRILTSIALLLLLYSIPTISPNPCPFHYPSFFTL